uniref:Uncharacterized protein n=1 Tax=Rhabditophanes sp. KR3021 TaxID=114890 RepID=A0AC35UEE3_9BILA
MNWRKLFGYKKFEDDFSASDVKSSSPGKVKVNKKVSDAHPNFNKEDDDVIPMSELNCSIHKPDTISFNERRICTPRSSLNNSPLSPTPASPLPTPPPLRRPSYSLLPRLYTIGQKAFDEEKKLIWTRFTNDINEKCAIENQTNQARDDNGRPPFSAPFLTLDTRLPCALRSFLRCQSDKKFLECGSPTALISQSTFPSLPKYNFPLIYEFGDYQNDRRFFLAENGLKGQNRRPPRNLYGKVKMCGKLDDIEFGVIFYVFVTDIQNPNPN